MEALGISAQNSAAAVRKTIALKRILSESVFKAFFPKRLCSVTFVVASVQSNKIIKKFIIPSKNQYNLIFFEVE
jgi:4'-phosphopantetheinyl transferase EntD